MYYYPDYSQVNYPLGGYYAHQDVPQMAPFPPNVTMPTTPQGMADQESYIENILRLNKGKMGVFFLTYENNSQWNAKVIRGIIETAGRDHIIVSDPQTGKRFLLLMVNLDYVEFDEPVNYFKTYVDPHKEIVTG